MRTRSALALSIAGILVTGSTALAVNTQTLNNSSPGTTGNASVLLPDGSATSTPAALPAAASSTDTTAAAAPRTNRTASPSPSSKPLSIHEAGDDKGGLRAKSEPSDDKGGLTNTIEPGDDKGGLTNTVEPGDDKGGSRAPEPGDDSGGHGGKDDD